MLFNNFIGNEKAKQQISNLYESGRLPHAIVLEGETGLGKRTLARDIAQALASAKTKPARDGLKAQKTEKARSAYRERHESDFIIADAATRYFRAHGVSKLPSHKALQAEIERLTAEKNAHYNEYREKKARVKELHTVKSNLSQILQGEKDREKKHEHER